MNTAEKLTPEEVEEGLAFDFIYFAPRCLKIQTMEGRLEDFELNEPQRLLEEIVAELKAAGLPVRLIILKARREGVSTWMSARSYHYTSSGFNRYAVTVTHEPEATDFLFKMVKRFHKNVPDWWRPSTKYSNMKLLEFNNTSGTGLDSAFRVGTAEKGDFGSGQLIHRLHLSEVAKWPKHTQKSLLTSLLQCVPDEPDTEVVFESTAKGIGGEFYKRFFAARYRYDVILDAAGKPQIRKTTNESAAPDNKYCAVFLPWFIFPKYRMEPPPGFVRYKKESNTQDARECEVTLAELYNLTDAHLAWRRYIIANKCGDSEDEFKQEYPSNPQEAFLSSGRPVFNNTNLLKLKKAAPKPIQRYDCLLSTGQWIAKADGGLRVWKEPIPGRPYVIGADVAEGLEHGDCSCADVVDHLTGEQVAQWHGHIDADLFGRLLAHLGRRYNGAWIGPERNNHGLTTVTTLVNLNYPHIYAEMVPEPPGKPRRRYGWCTSWTTRPLIIDNLIELMREGSHGIRCAETFEEMMSFKIQADGKQQAEEGMWDDRVMSYAIVQQLRRSLLVVRTETSGGTTPGARAVVRNQRPPREAYT